jgi:signal transduction histidine kinase
MRIAVLEKRKRLMVWISVAGGMLLLLALATFFLFWRWMAQKKQSAEQQVKQMEQEKHFIATQAVLNGEIQERIRLARDLHDGLGSILAAARYNFTELKKTAGLESLNMECYDTAMDLLDDSMREMRRVAHHLIPDALGSFGLKQSIADFCNTMPHVKFSYYGDEARLKAHLEVMLYRMMHELVSNALKHSRAQQIFVEIVRYDEYISLTVQDDGCGFDLNAERMGMGLANIRARVAACNGNLMIDSKKGVGTEINVELRL